MIHPSRIHLSSLAEQETLPLPTEAVRSATTFRAYLRRYRLDLLTVSQAAGVRLIVVWNLMQGIPVRPAQASRVRAALLRLTGVPYHAAIPISLQHNLVPRPLRSAKQGGIQ